MSPGAGAHGGTVGSARAWRRSPRATASHESYGRGPVTPDPSRHAKASALFLAAREVEPGARVAYLERECGGDVGLRRDVEALLASDDDAFLDEAPLGRGAAAAAAGILNDERGAAPAEAPRTLGPFRILSTLGEGGMGVVYAAEQ